MITDLDGSELRFRESADESARFGVTMARLAITADWPVAKADDLAELLGRDDIGVIVARFPSERSDLPRHLSSPNRVALPAGTLNYWELSTDETPLPTKPGTSVRAVVDSDKEVVRSLIADVFAGYVNHYSVNPLLDASLVSIGYADWATKTVLDPSGRGFLMIGDEGPIGVATVGVTGAGDWEVELAGVASRARGRGAYQALSAIHAAARGWRSSTCDFDPKSQYACSALVGTVRVPAPLQRRDGTSGNAWCDGSTV